MSNDVAQDVADELDVDAVVRLAPLAPGAKAPVNDGVERRETRVRERLPRILAIRFPAKNPRESLLLPLLLGVRRGWPRGLRAGLLAFLARRRGPVPVRAPPRPPAPPAPAAPARGAPEAARG